MTEKRSVATGQVFTHVKRAVSAIDRFTGYGTTDDGVLRSHIAQRASLKIAAEEIRKALAVMEKIRWG
jgi:hypothetical protein